MGDNENSTPSPFEQEGKERLSRQNRNEGDMPFNRPGGVDAFKNRTPKPRRAANSEPAEEAPAPARARRAAPQQGGLPPRAGKQGLPPRATRSQEKPVSRAKSESVVEDEEVPTRARNRGQGLPPRAKNSGPLPLPNRQEDNPSVEPQKAVEDQYAPEPQRSATEPQKAPESAYEDTVEDVEAVEDELEEVVAPPVKNTPPKKDRVINLNKESFGEWDKDDEEDDNSAEEASGHKKFTTKQRSFRITERDLTIIQFFARYRYGTKEQAADLVDTSSNAINGRILKMGHSGFLRKENVANGKGVWTPTTLGLGVIDSEFKPLNSNNISLVTMSHTLGLGNIGIEIETGNVAKLLNMDVDTTRTITEREISSSFNYIRKSREIRENMEEFEYVSDEGIILEDEEYNVDGRSPELVPGNEGLFVINDDKYHVPDMVIPLPRDESGFPQSIGIELELNTKPDKEWTRILVSYRESMLFGKVVYFTHKKAIMSRIVSIAKGLGLNESQFDVRKYTPKTDQLILG